MGPLRRMPVLTPVRMKPKTKARILKALANVKRVKEEMAEDEEEADIKELESETIALLADLSALVARDDHRKVLPQTKTED